MSDPLCGPKAFRLISIRVCSGRGFGAFFALYFHACVVCAGEHDVYCETPRLLARGNVVDSA